MGGLLRIFANDNVLQTKFLGMEENGSCRTGLR
jgi:hypothetical protein